MISQCLNDLERASEFRQRRIYAWPLLFEELLLPSVTECLSKCLYYTSRRMEKFPKVAKHHRPWGARYQHNQPQQDAKAEDKLDDSDDKAKSENASGENAEKPTESTSRYGYELG